MQFSLSLPTGWRLLKNSPDHSARGIVLKAARLEPEAIILVRCVPGKLVQGFSMKTLPDSVIKAFEAKFKDFRLIKNDLMKVDDQPTLRLRYHRLSPKDKLVYESSMYILPTHERTFYIEARAKASDFGRIEASVEKIINSLQLPK